MTSQAEASFSTYPRMPARTASRNCRGSFPMSISMVLNSCGSWPCASEMEERRCGSKKSNAKTSHWKSGHFGGTDLTYPASPTTIRSERFRQSLFRASRKRRFSMNRNIRIIGSFAAWLNGPLPPQVIRVACAEGVSIPGNSRHIFRTRFGCLGVSSCGPTLRSSVVSSVRRKLLA